MTMPSKHSGPVKRWVEAEQGVELDAHLGDVFRALEHEAPMSTGELSAVGRRLAQGQIAGTRRRRAFPQLMLAFAVLVGASGAAFAQWKRPGFWQLQAYFAPRAVESARAPLPAKLAKPSSAARAKVAEAAPAGSAVPLTALLPETAEVGAPGPSASSGSKAALGRPSALARESELLQKALAKLRRDHNGPAALGLLDQYQAEFPHGELATEASFARVDALLLAGKRNEALGLLSRLPLDGVGRKTELRLLRAELYAERNCSQALPDFDAVLGGPAGAGLSERALYGRAACRLRLGNTAGGRADLEAYLQSYPSGRFAEQVRSRLAAP
jgi:hypothetical protein